MDTFIHYWIDIIWVPILFFGVHKVHRWWSLGFVISTMIFMRLQAEIMTHIDYPTGIMSILESNVYSRGIVINSTFYVLFLLMAHFSSGTRGVVFMAACLSIFFMIFVCNAVIMLL